MIIKNQKRYQIVKNILQRDGLYIERTNSWHNRFRKLFTRYEKKSENYLGLVQFSCCIIDLLRN
jgi:transposase